MFFCLCLLYHRLSVLGSSTSPFRWTPRPLLSKPRSQNQSSLPSPLFPCSTSLSSPYMPPFPLFIISFFFKTFPSLKLYFPRWRLQETQAELRILVSPVPWITGISRLDSVPGLGLCLYQPQHLTASAVCFANSCTEWAQQHPSSEKNKQFKGKRWGCFPSQGSSTVITQDAGKPAFLKIWLT